MAPSETALSHCIRDALGGLGVWVIRVQAGKHRVKGGVLHCAEPGTPDLFCPALNLWLEVKLPEGKPLPTQIAWHARAGREGVAVVVVRSVADAVRAALAVRQISSPSRAYK